MRLQEETWRQQGDVAHVVDGYGGRSPLAAVAGQLQAAACEAIFALTTARAATARPPAGDVVQLVEVLGKLLAPHADVHRATTARSIALMLAAFQTVIAPAWQGPDGVPTAEDAALGSLLRSAEVSQALQALPERSGIAAAAHLALSVSVAAFHDCSDSRDVSNAVQRASKALDAGALNALVRTFQQRQAIASVPSHAHSCLHHQARSP